MTYQGSLDIMRLLEGEDDAIYAARLVDSDWDCGMDGTELQAAFHLIQSSWTD